MPVDFDPANKYILITSPTTEISALDIYNAAMEWADEAENMIYLVPMAAYGKFLMGTGVYSDSIFVLLNGWKLKPYSGNYTLTITGTLITDDGSTRVVLPNSVNVTWIFQVSSQGTITQLEDITAIKKVQLNRWRILNNQLLIYDNDGVTVLYTFNLKDSSGNPAEANVYERVPT